MPELPERPSRTLLLISTDLMARSRLEPAARAAGLELATADPSSLAERAGELRPALLVADLDAGKAATLEAIEKARAEGLLPGIVVGYFSHVDTELQAAAEGAGVRAVARGRFWRTVEDICTEAAALA